MSPSELQFINGVYIITVCSLILRIVSNRIFALTLRDEDIETLQKQLDRPVATHTHILAWISFISGLSLFVNSAILGSIAIKEFIL